MEAVETRQTPEELFVRHQADAKKLACGIARRIGPRLRYAEAVNAALIGLWHASRKYQEYLDDTPETLRQFWTYAVHRVRGSIFDYLREQYPVGTRRMSKDEREATPATFSLQELCQEHRGPDDSGMDRITALTDPHDDCGDIDTADEAQRLLQYLTPRQRTICIGYYLQGRTHQDIGNSIGISESYVSMILSALRGQADAYRRNEQYLQRRAEQRVRQQRKRHLPAFWRKRTAI